MKRNALLRCIVFVLVLGIMAISLIGCEGPAGPAGSTGPAGTMNTVPLFMQGTWETTNGATWVFTADKATRTTGSSVIRYSCIYLSFEAAINSGSNKDEFPGGYEMTYMQIEGGSAVDKMNDYTKQTDTFYFNDDHTKMFSSVDYTKQ